ncbi:MAG: carboxypeptidase regulatory-like domain-containing protein, partial [Motilibacteraceae bacterium]
MSTPGQGAGGEATAQPLVVELTGAAAAAGRTAQVRVVLRNTGTVPLQARLWVLGLEQAWCPAPPTLQVAAGDVVETFLPLTPAAGTPAGEYPWSLAVDVLDSAGRPAGRRQVLGAVLGVDERPRVAVTLVPPEVRLWRRKRVRVVLDNASPAPATVQLRASATEGLRVSTPEEPTVVPAGGSLRLPITVHVRRPTLLGSRRRLPWTVHVDSVSAPAYADGVVSTRPLLPSSLARVVALVTVIALWAGLGIVTVPRLASKVAANREAATAPRTPPPSSTTGGGSAKGGDGKGGSGGGASKGGSGGGGGTATVSPVSSTAGAVRFSGTVTGTEPAGVSVALRQVSLVDEAADGAVRVGGPAAPSGTGKILGTSLASFPRAATSPARSTASNDQGGWSFAGIPAPGYYLLTFAKPGYQTMRYVLDSSSPVAQEPLEVALTAGQGKVSGSVTDDAGAKVGGASITITDGTVTLTTSTASSGPGMGTFSVDGLSTPSTYLVSASRAGSALASQLVSLSAGGSADVALTLKRGVESIAGTVTAPTTLKGVTGLGSATITATNGSISRSVTTVSTGPIGSYTLSDLPLGEWTVTVSADGYLAQTTRITLDGKASSAAFSTQLQFSTAVVQGTVVADKDGTGIVGAGLTLTGPAGTFKTTSVSTPSGGFSFTGVPPGSYTLTATYFGFSDTSASVTADVASPQTVTLKMPAAADAGPPATGRISGTTLDGFTLSPVTCPKDLATCVHVEVLDTGDKPTSLASADVAPTASYLLPAADATGLKPGLYTVRISAPAYQPSVLQIRVGQGATVTAPQALLYPYGSIIGTIGTRTGSLPAGTCVIAVKLTSSSTNPIDPSTAVCDPAATTPATPPYLPSAPPDYGCPATGVNPSSSASDGYWCAIVGADGLYTVPDVPAGTYAVVVVPSNTDYVPTTPARITLTPGQTARYDATISRYGVLTVTTRAPLSSDPNAPASLVEGVTITATTATPGITVAPVTTSDGNDGRQLGTATLTGLRAATYTITATYTVNSTTLTATSNVPVSLDQTRTLNLVLTTGAAEAFIGRLKGLVNGVDTTVGYADVQVTAVSGYSDSTGQPYTATVSVEADANGCFAVLPQGETLEQLQAAATADTANSCSFTIASLAGTIVPGSPLPRPPAVARATIINPSVSVAVGPSTSTEAANLTSRADGTVQKIVVPEKRRTVRVTLAAPGSTSDLGATVTVKSQPVEAGSITTSVGSGTTDATDPSAPTTTYPVTLRDAGAGTANSLLPGTYLLSVTAPGYAPVERTLTVPLQDGTDPFTPPTISLTPLQNLAVKVQYDQPLASAKDPTTRVTLTLPDGSTKTTTLSAFTDATARTTSFTFADLSPVDKNGNTAPYGLTVEAGGYEKQSFSGQTLAQLAALSPVTLVRQAAITVDLQQTVGSTQSGLPGVTITAKGPGGTFTATTGDKGIAYLEGTLANNGLTAGTYTVTAQTPTGYETISLDAGCTSTTSGCDVTVAAATADTKASTAALSASTSPTPISFKVTVTGDGKPLTGASVVLATSDATLFGGASTKTATDNGDGTYTFTGVVPTDYTMSISASTFSGLTNIPVNLTPGQTPPPYSYDLAAETNTVYVDVTGLPNSDPVNDATLTLCQGGSATCSSPLTPDSTTPPTDGEYKFSSVRSNGTYTLSVSAQGYVTHTEKFSISGGITKTIAVSLAVATQKVVVTLTNVVNGVPLDGASIALQIAPGWTDARAQEQQMAVVSKTASSWTATFASVPYGKYVAVYRPTTNHFGSGSSAAFDVATTATLADPQVSASVQADEHAITIQPRSSDGATVSVALQLTEPDGTTDLLSPAPTVNTGSSGDTRYYLPDLTSGTSHIWTVTATPSDLTAYVADSETFTATANTNVTVTVQKTGSAVVTVTPDSGTSDKSGISVTASCGSKTTTVSGSTGTDGTITLAGLVPGSCTVTARGITKPVSITSGAAAAVTIDVSADLTVTVLATDPTTSTTAAVSGAKVQVLCSKADNSGLSADYTSSTLTSDKDGKATFDGTSSLPPLGCSVVVTTSDGKTTLATKGTSLSSGANTLDVDLPTAAITVTDNANKGVSGATVNVTCGSYTTSATTDASGLATFAGGTLPAGSCTFQDGTAGPKVTTTLGTALYTHPL